MSNAFGLAMLSQNDAYLEIMTSFKPTTKKQDQEKVASSASDACGYFVESHAILRTFWVKNSNLLSQFTE